MNEKTSSLLEKLIRRESVLKRALALSQVGIWYLDAAANTLSWTAEAYKIFGVPEGTPVDYKVFLSCVHPDDRKLVDQRTWGAALSGGHYEIEHRIVINGRERWVYQRSEHDMDAAGNQIGTIGIVRDITEQKRIELLMEHMAQRDNKTESSL